MFSVWSNYECNHCKNLCTRFCMNMYFPFSQVNIIGFLAHLINNMFNFIRNCHTVFQSAVPFLLPPLMYEYLLPSLPYFILSVFKAVLSSRRSGYFIVVLLCISLIMNVTKHHFCVLLCHLYKFIQTNF